MDLKSLTRRAALTILSSMLCLVAFAQNHQVTGTIRDVAGEPMIGVNVLEKGTTNGTITDFDGNYSLSVDGNGVLVFSYIGFQSQEIAVANKTKIDVTMAEDTETFEDTLYESWEILFQTVHQMIRSYGELHRIRLGTTATVILMIKGRYYTAHVGDSRIYEIRKGVIRQLTQDQNVANVSLPEEQYVTRAGEKKKSSSILLQGIGASKAVRPVYDSGELQYNAVYLLCSDGFRNKTGEDELAGRFDPGKIATGEAMKLQAEEFIQILRGRGERDDITVLLIRTMDVQN